MAKKTLTFLYIILFIVLVYFLQLFVVDTKTLFGVKPNLILITVIVVSLWYGVYTGTIFAFIIGVITDFVFGSTTGMFTIAYTITGAITGIINTNYRKENKLSLIYVTLIFTFVFELIQYIEYLILTGVYSSFFYLLKQVIISSILNVTIVVIVYGIIYKIMEKFESNLRRDSAI